MFEAFASPRNKNIISFISLGAIGITFLGLFFAAYPEVGSHSYNWAFWTKFYTIEGNALFYKGLILFAAASVILMGIDYKPLLSRFTDSPNSEEHTGEYSPLILMATAGMMWMVSAKDLVSIFVSLELTTITFYVLVAFMRRNVGSLEAGVKYLILGALSTGIFVYGIAWVYGITGTTSIEGIRLYLATQTLPSYGLLFGLALLLLSIAFKVGAAPMQLWIPDVYQGAPTPTTAFLSVASKASGFAVAVALLTPFLESNITGPSAGLMLAVMAGLTLVIGNLSAIGQSNFKRLLAYSSIAHAGFILIALAVWTSPIIKDNVNSPQIIAFYLATYAVMTLGAFFLLNIIRLTDDSEEINGFHGLAKRSPITAFCGTVLMASMAGVPLTAGFWGKFFVIRQAAIADLWWLIAIIVLSVGAGFYYYLKVVAAMYWDKPVSENKLVISKATCIYLIAATAITLVLGIFPTPLMSLLQ